jgi:hypothetical protein
MRQREKPAVIPAVEQAMRDQEVQRAARELAAYFKGKRTEREARAALKIIKSFVRDREDLDPKNRPALPGLGTGKAPKPSKKPAARRAAKAGTRRRAPAEVSQPPEPALEPPSE